MTFRSRPDDRVVAACACGTHGFVEMPHSSVALFDVGLVSTVAKLAQWARSGRGRWRYPASVKRGAACVYLHRLAAGAKRGQVVDHVSGDVLDARASNLRICTSTQNILNAGKSKSANCQFKGVFYHKDRGRWSSHISAGGVRLFLGYFSTPQDAAAAYDRACVDLHGDFARPNSQIFPSEVWA